MESEAMSSSLPDHHREQSLEANSRQDVVVECPISQATTFCEIPWRQRQKNNDDQLIHKHSQVMDNMMREESQMHTDKLSESELLYSSSFTGEVLVKKSSNEILYSTIKDPTTSVEEMHLERSPFGADERKQKQDLSIQRISCTFVNSSVNNTTSESQVYTTSTSRRFHTLGPSIYAIPNPKTLIAKNERRQMNNATGYVRIKNGRMVSSPEDDNLACSDETSTQTKEFLPIILDVRGNANDLDDVVDDFEETPKEHIVETKRLHVIEKSPQEGVKEIGVETPSLLSGEDHETYASDLLASSSSCLSSHKPNKPNGSSSSSLSSNLTLSSNLVTSQVPLSTKSILSSAQDLQRLPHLGHSAINSVNVGNTSSLAIRQIHQSSSFENSVSSNKIAVSQLRGVPTAGYQSQKGKKICIIAKDGATLPKYTISLLKPPQNQSVSGTTGVTSSALNLFTDSKGVRCVKSIYNLNPNVSVKSAYPSTTSTPTILVNTQRSKSITTPRVVVQQPNHLSRNLELVNHQSFENSHESATQSQSMPVESSQFTGMNRQDIVQSGILNVMTKSRTDLHKLHVCNICGDEFHTEEFLQFHLERTVFVLSYVCSQCDKLMTFHNKCSFWRHLLKEVTNSDIQRLKTEKTFMKLEPYLALKALDDPSVSSSKSCESVCGPIVQMDPPVGLSKSSEPVLTPNAHKDPPVGLTKSSEPVLTPNAHKDPPVGLPKSSEPVLASNVQVDPLVVLSKSSKPVLATNVQIDTLVGLSKSSEPVLAPNVQVDPPVILSKSSKPVLATNVQIDLPVDISKSSEPVLASNVQVDPLVVLSKSSKLVLATNVQIDTLVGLSKSSEPVLAPNVQVDPLVVSSNSSKPVLATNVQIDQPVGLSKSSESVLAPNVQVDPPVILSKSSKRVLATNVQIDLPVDISKSSEPILAPNIQRDPTVTLSKSCEQHPSPSAQKYSPVTSCQSHEPHLHPNAQKGPHGTLSKSSESEVKLYLCSFCRTEFSTPLLLVSHFQRVVNLYTCSICEMTLFNLCSLAAHKEIHTLETSHGSITCPECGEMIPYSQDHKEVFEHLDLCFHFNVSHAFSCKCGDILSPTISFEEHIFKKHLYRYFRCCTCNHMFQGRSPLTAHHEAKHPNGVLVSAVAVLCTLCKQFFNNPPDLHVHVEKEASSFEKRIKKRYQCSLCTNAFASTKLLHDHIEDSHTHKVKRCTLCFALFQSRQNLVRHIVTKNCPKQLPKHLHLCLDNHFGMESSMLNYTLRKKVFNDNLYISLFSPRSSETLIPDGSESGLAQNQNTPLSIPQNSTCSTTTTSMQIAVTSITLGNKQNSSQPDQSTSVYLMSPQTVQSLDSSSTKGHRYLKQCHSCKICLIGSDNYEWHMSLHKKQGVNVNLKMGRTHCMICRKLISDTHISTHLVEHQRQGVIICCLCHRRDFASMELARKHSKNWCYYKLVQGWGEEQFREKYGRKQVLGVGTDNGSEQCERQIQARIPPPTVSNDESDELEEVVEGDSNNDNNDNLPDSNLNLNENESVFPCLMCGLAFSTEKARIIHVNRVHDGTRTIFFCMICRGKGFRKAFGRKQKASLHISRKHRIMTPYAISKFILEEELNISNGEIVPSISTPADTDAPPPKRLRLQAEGSFLCGKCGFTDSQKDIFGQHIKTHNPKCEPQCPECGLCFTVSAALRKHIFAIHKIKDVDGYLKEGGIESTTEEPVSEDEEMYSSPDVDVVHVMITEASPPPAKKSDDLTKKILSNKSIIPHWECNVCYKKFSCEVYLKNHMRSHGMAFIRSRRHQKT